MSERVQSTPNDAAGSDAQPKLETFGYRQQLQRSMSLTDVVVFGIIYMVPLAPLPVFGIVFNFSHGMAALVYLVAAVAMVFSALSYREMARRYPVAGSVYSYVRLGLSNFVGFMAGWAILLDYLLLPALLSVFAAAAMVSIFPATYAWMWIILFVVIAAAINLLGINMTSAMNKLFLAIQLIVLAIFIVGALVALARGTVALSLTPLYNGDGFSWGIVFGAIPIAALSFIGFDAISTLNEEARGGGETVSRATMIVLVAVTFLFVVQVYLAAIFVPAATTFADGDETNNAFYHIAGDVVGHWFEVVVTLTSALIAIFAEFHCFAINLIAARLQHGSGPLPAPLPGKGEFEEGPRERLDTHRVPVTGDRHRRQRTAGHPDNLGHLRRVDGLYSPAYRCDREPRHSAALEEHLPALDLTVDRYGSPRLCPVERRHPRQGRGLLLDGDRDHSRRVLSAPPSGPRAPGR
ncbi:MFS family permease [Mycobacterium sp. URHB0021]